MCVNPCVLTIADRRKLRIKIGKSALEMSTIGFVACRLQSGQRAGTRQHQSLAARAKLQFVRCRFRTRRRFVFRLALVDLILNRLAFPAASHMEDYTFLKSLRCAAVHIDEAALEKSALGSHDKCHK